MSFAQSSQQLTSGISTCGLSAAEAARKLQQDAEAAAAKAAAAANASAPDEEDDKSNVAPKKDEADDINEDEELQYFQAMQEEQNQQEASSEEEDAAVAAVRLGTKKRPASSRQQTTPRKSQRSAKTLGTGKAHPAASPVPRSMPSQAKAGVTIAQKQKAQAQTQNQKIVAPESMPHESTGNASAEAQKQQPWLCTLHNLLLGDAVKITDANIKSAIEKAKKIQGSKVDKKLDYMNESNSEKTFSSRTTLLRTALECAKEVRGLALASVKAGLDVKALEKAITDFQKPIHDLLGTDTFIGFPVHWVQAG